MAISNSTTLPLCESTLRQLSVEQAEQALRFLDAFRKRDKSEPLSIAIERLPEIDDATAQIMCEALENGEEAKQ